MCSNPNDRPGFVRRPGAASQRGVVMIITLLAIVLLAALLAWVLNTGRMVNARQVAQSAADATAVGGAGKLARTLNLLAHHNVEMARIIPAAAYLDAAPQATRFALKDQRAALERVEQQLSAGTPADAPWVEDQLQTIRDALAQDVATLEPVDQLLTSGYDVREMAWYETPSGELGLMWRSMYAMDAVNQGVAEAMAEAVQTSAVQSGEVNLARDDAEAYDALLSPILTTIPVERTSFDDFKRPVTMGLLPEDTDDRTTNRGPYDAVFGWRDYNYRNVPGTFTPGTQSPISGSGSGNLPISGGVAPGGTGGSWDRERTGYRTYGPASWLGRRHGWWNWRHLRYARFGSYIRRLATHKMHQLWADYGADQTVIDPEWITDWTMFTFTANNNASAIREISFVAIEIKSRYPFDHPEFFSPGSWDFVRDRDDRPHRIIRTGFNSGTDPRFWDAMPTIEQVGDFIWRDQWAYAADFDHDIGIDEEQVYDEDTGEWETIPQPVYRIDHFIWAGINVGEPTTIENPYNQPADVAMPAPTLLDRDVIDLTPDVRRNWFTFLGVVRRADSAPAWPSRFRAGSPDPWQVAVAQAYVYNNHSWDLWTPMWQSQLEPVVDLEGWAALLDSESGDAAAVAVMNESAAEELAAYLNRVAPLAPISMRH